MVHFRLYGTVFWQLLRTELIQLRKTFFGQAIDLAIWVFCSVFVLSYLLGSQFNISQDMNFGVFNMAGCVATVGVFDSYANMFNVLGDLEGPSSLTYYVALPVPAWLVFMSKMIYWAIFIFLKACVALVVGKIVLWDAFDISSVAIVPLISVLVFSNILYGTFSFFVVSLVPSIARARSVWMRCIFPLWFFGGFQFSWFTMYKLAPKLAYVTLMNPIIYIMESTRAVILGQEGYLPWPLCIGAMCFFIVFFGVVSIVRMKKRLDLV